MLDLSGIGKVAFEPFTPGETYKKGQTGEETCNFWSKGTMNNFRQLQTAAMISAWVLAAGQGLVAQPRDSSAKDRAGIEQLHRLDIKSTLTDKADGHAKLWDDDAVQIEPGEPAEIGKAAIYADVKRSERANCTAPNPFVIARR